MTMPQMIETEAVRETDADYGFAVVGRVLVWLTAHYHEQPSLDEIAHQTGMSAYHLQRMFTRYVGVSPKKFVQYLTLEHAKRALADSRSVLDAAFETGLSGPGRLHDLFVTHDAMTPGEWKRRGDLRLSYGWHESPFGECLIVATERGVCGLAFNGLGDRSATLDELRRSLGEAALEERPDATRVYAEAAFGRGRLHLDLRGTPFQLKVWQGLLRIPPGAVLTYADLAARIGAPSSARAVAGAVARNPVSWVIPCHRVIRGSGVITGYRWQPAKKRLILAWEAARAAEAG
jgi:AraC family transcriptional regulator of adaptative response/methylated-DNA-[protein]-cysteine methyltransferase